MIAGERSMTATKGVCAAEGFQVGVAAADIRGDGDGSTDLALVVSDRPAWSAGVFTQSVVRAAPVTVSELALQHGEPVSAVVINSGNANACTGSKGNEDAQTMVKVTAESLNVDPEAVLVCSTGVIGRPMPMEKISSGINLAARSLTRDGTAAATAIMTTDTRPKTAEASFTVGDRLYTVGGMAKGVGMIHPNMATLIAVVTTDAPVSGCEPLQGLLRDVCDETLNCITVDGDTSTNDTLLLLANGAAGGTALAPRTEGFESLRSAVYDVCESLAEQVIADGEGATKYFEVTVTGALSVGDARKAAITVAGSPLVKTAIHGNDPNWGRILMALGRAYVPFSVESCTVRIGDIDVFVRGTPQALDADAMSKLFAKSPISISIDLGAGPGRGHAWGCDLTAEYVRINAEYTT
jgi:glutamate N-acetyltransferase / amino-acid N-acetyltransferase